MMTKRIARLLLVFMSAFLAAGLFHTPVHAASSSEQPLRPVQVFDVEAGKVVKTIPNDAAFQKMAASWTKSITGLAPQLSPDQACSYVYRVPLAKPATVKAGHISVTTSDLFLFYCKEQPPVLLAFDAERRPFLFLFKADIAPFIKKVGLPASVG
ncbi:hypothetical protein D3P08_08875 [Paenibacillus nanensis]|uniref:Uncharacterized protein n=1 Tax=Paenibacillus nanensis TaxID=393251 RepID=A0A3A1V176_9BACL|nr:hypothetical protein [Paenibacillus nanensis]RIX53541.1 hypothetical protein D3P08_08875 [Paenibacillus nanensis]